MQRYSCLLFNRDGTGGAVVHSSRPIKACGVCMAKVSAYLCDYPMGPPTLDHNASRDVGAPVYQPPTCDAPLCEDCRVPQSPDIDYCPNHTSETSHHIGLSEDSHVIDKSHTSQMTQVVDELAQERLL